MENPKRTLKDIDLLAALPPEEMAILSRRCHWQRYAADERVVGQEDETRDVLLVVTGKVKVVLYSACGKVVSLRDLPAGKMFGELSAIDGRPRSATVVALEDSLIASMAPMVFWDLLIRHPEVIAPLLCYLTDLIRSLSERVFEFSTLAVKNRIHAELLRLARQAGVEGTTAVIAAAPTHAEIASRISSHREAVTRELNYLAQIGLIERRCGALVIQDVKELARLIGVDPYVDGPLLWEARLRCRDDSACSFFRKPQHRV